MVIIIYLHFYNLLKSEAWETYWTITYEYALLLICIVPNNKLLLLTNKQLTNTLLLLTNKQLSQG